MRLTRRKHGYVGVAHVPTSTAMERPFCHIIYLELWTSIALLPDADHRRANCIATTTAGQSL